MVSLYPRLYRFVTDMVNDDTLWTRYVVFIDEYSSLTWYLCVCACLCRAKEMSVLHVIVMCVRRKHMHVCTVGIRFIS